jgi:MFS family permease
MPRLNPGQTLRSLVPRTRDGRVYLMAAFINTYGTGLIITAGMLYGIKVIHLTPAQTGLGLTLASLVGLLSSVPIGRLADLHGPREVFALSLLVSAAAYVSYVFLAHNFVGFLLVAIVDMAALNASGTVAVALTRRVGGEDATTLRAQMNAVLNLGSSLGVATCGIAIQINTVTAYRALLLGNALCTLAGAAILSLLPKYAPLAGARMESPLAALKDKAFVGYTLLSGGMFLQYLVLALLMPVWVVFHTNAPRWSISAFVIVNTLILFLFQVRVAKKVQTVRQGGAAFRRSGVIFLITCSAMGLASGLASWAAFLLLGAAVVLATYGELWQSSAMFALDFGLAPPHAQGQNQGLVSTANFGAVALAPFLLVGVVVASGRFGFVMLGVWFALLGLTAPAVARWGERTRPATPAPEAEADAAPATEAVTD